MIKWLIDKKSKIPLYLQLKDLIKYYLSTGKIINNQQLPAIKDLAKELQINLNTVRKAYKDLELEGLISMKRGVGSIITNLNKRPDLSVKDILDPDPKESLLRLMRQLLKKGMTINDVDGLFSQCLREISSSQSKDYIIFTECNKSQTIDISDQLKNYLQIDVHPVDLEELEAFLDRQNQSIGTLLAIVTTGFHLNEVYRAIGVRPISVYMLVTNMSPSTRQSLEKSCKNNSFGFICRDYDSMIFLPDVIRAEIGYPIDLTSCVFSDKNTLFSILNRVDIILATPPVFEEVQRMAPSNKPVYNILDRIDPISLVHLKDNLFFAPLNK
ncbi:MAG: GntR family transcriptional regulator [Acidobacteriota bacterium]|nr:GntR family transcriptional regulator [Acidobacteriota bacterium]